LYAPLLSDSEERIEAHRCWAGTRNGAIEAVAAGALCEMDRSEKARRAACNRGGMVWLWEGWRLGYHELMGGGEVRHAEILGAKKHSRGLFRSEMEDVDHDSTLHLH
jgi:hypothetical protein